MNREILHNSAVKRGRINKSLPGCVVRTRGQFCRFAVKCRHTTFGMHGSLPLSSSSQSDQSLYIRLCLTFFNELLPYNGRHSFVWTAEKMSLTLYCSFYSILYSIFTSTSKHGVHGWFLIKSCESIKSGRTGFHVLSLRIFFNQSYCSRLGSVSV